MKELVINIEELKQLNTYLDEIPHKYAKYIERFLIAIQVKRAQENQPSAEGVRIPEAEATPQQ